MPAAPQNYKNHGRIIPLYHGVTFSILIVNVMWATTRLIDQPGIDRAVALLTAAALVLLFFYARIFALRVQDRVIRLEMRLRLREVLPVELQGAIPALTLDQLVALRFASDAELPALVRRVVDERIADRRTIKQMITDWQADCVRA